MHNRTSPRPSRRRSVAALAALGASAALAFSGPALAAPHDKPAPPPKPATGAISQASVERALGNKQAQAELVGKISGERASSQILQNQLIASSQAAEQLSALRESQKQMAEQKAVTANKAVVAARAKTATTRLAYVRWVTNAYYSDDADVGDATALLTASDPSQLLTDQALATYQAKAKAKAVGSMQTAEIYQSNVEARAKTAQAKAAAAAKAAVQAYTAARKQVQANSVKLAAITTQLQTQTAQLSALTSVANSAVSKRNAWVSYQQSYSAYQVKLAAYNKHQAELRAEAEARARARERQQQHNGGGSSGGGSSGGGGGGSSSPPPSGGSWTAAKGERAAQRALSEVGLMYAWAGGNQYGPTRGVCAGDGAWNDCNVIGFDCSGLAMYAWGQPWVHYAAWQYQGAGSYHPSPGNLRPGDLLFWSNTGSPSGIHHVAIAIGGGRMVEAPESGVPIRTASIWEYGNIDYTVRPLT